MASTVVSASSWKTDPRPTGRTRRWAVAVPFVCVGLAWAGTDVPPPEAGLVIEPPSRVAPERGAAPTAKPLARTRALSLPPEMPVNGAAPRVPQVELAPPPVEVKPAPVMDAMPTPPPDAASSQAAATPAPLTTAMPSRVSRDQLYTARHTARVFYRLADDPRVLVLDMPDVVDQARVFARIVIFIERANAPRHRILSVPEIKRWQEVNKETLATLTIGNNIRADNFTRFFNTARQQGEAITEDEAWLLEHLLKEGVLVEVNGAYVTQVPEQIVISAPQPALKECATCLITQARRELILRHELAHARFVTDQVYRDYVEWFWHNQLNAEQRRTITKYLQSLGYDITLPELVIDEMQAFVLHTPESEFFSAKSAGFTSKQLEALRERFWTRLAEPRPLKRAAHYRLP